MKFYILIVVLSFTFCIACKKEEAQKSDQAEIVSFSIGSFQDGEAEFSFENDSAKIKLWANDGIDLSTLKPTIVVSDFATITPASGEVVNFLLDNGKYVYRVISESGLVKQWYIQIIYNSSLVLIPNNGEWDSNVKVYEATEYNDFLTRYEGWNGGDGCYSVLLPNGDILWTFQDSFFGHIESNRSRVDNTFVRNAAFIQQDMSLDDIVQLNPGQGNQAETWTKYAGSADDEDWYWTGDSHVHNGKLQVLMGHITTTGNGAWDFKQVSTDVGVFSLPDLTLEKIVKDVDKSSVPYSSGLFDASDGYTYLYGNENGYLTSYLRIARVQAGDLTSPWEYLTKSGWSQVRDDHYILQNVTVPNVFEKDGKYYLVSQEIIFGRDIYIWEAPSPIGPWTNKRTIYKIPEKYTHPEFITYNSTIHAHLSKEGELVLAYNINPTDFWSNFNNPGSADRYRPYFVRIYNWE
ncbi:DUF5005 domain-containing protein [Sunxiuqinia sp. A32]|uniref:DUF5005 domain-containing protein n=1 Tax=Sunxiuqinia sp. A32 TaxID=3461496 RepID=UPI004045BE5F